MRDKLERFAVELRALINREAEERKFKYFPSSIDPELAEFMAGGIERFLSNEADSLDEALGLKRGRGRPKTDLTSGKHFELVCKLIFMRARERDPVMTWEKCCEELGYEGDPSELRKIYDRYLEPVKSHFVAKISEDLAASDPPRG